MTRIRALIAIAVLASCAFLAARAYAEFKKNAEIFNKVAEAGTLLNKNKYGEVITLLENVLPSDVSEETNADLVSAIGIGYNHLGVAYLKVGKYKRAIDALTRSREALPRWAIPCYLLGQAYCGIGEYRQSAANFDKGIQLDPTVALPEDYQLLIISYLKTGRKEDADTTFNMAKARFGRAFAATSVDEIARVINKAN